MRGHGALIPEVYLHGQANSTPCIIEDCRVGNRKETEVGHRMKSPRR